MHTTCRELVVTVPPSPMVHPSIVSHVFSLFFFSSYLFTHTPQTLEENQLFIQATVENQNQGKLDDCVQYLQLLHQNLLFLAAVGDCLPPPQP